MSLAFGTRQVSSAVPSATMRAMEVQLSIARNAFMALSVLSLLVTACGSSIAASTPVDADAVSTSLVGTLVASLFQTRTALAPRPLPSNTATPAALPPLTVPTAITATSTYLYLPPTLGIFTPTFTPSVTGTVFTPTVDPNTLAYGCNNLVFVRDVTIPAGTTMKPGEDFGKTWKVANTGTCDWMYQYAIVLISGDAMSGKTTKLNRVVTAGHWAELTVQMGAPKSPGTYTAYWRLSDADGHMFGASLAVSVVVEGNPTKTPVPPTKTKAPTSTPTETPTSTPTSIP